MLAYIQLTARAFILLTGSQHFADLFLFMISFQWLVISISHFVVKWKKHQIKMTTLNIMVKHYENILHHNNCKTGIEYILIVVNSNIMIAI